jgi:hypothetical protein
VTRAKPGAGENLLHQFVDGIFTTLFEGLFTNVFDVTGQMQVSSCVYRVCNAD